MTKLNPEVFEYAAVLLEVGAAKYACNAVADAERFVDMDGGDHGILFKELFKPKRLPADAKYNGWWGNSYCVNPDVQQRRLEARILALLLTAQICEDQLSEKK